MSLSKHKSHNYTTDESSLGYSSQKLVNSIRFGDHSVTFFSAIQWKQHMEHNLNNGVLVGGVKREKGWS